MKPDMDKDSTDEIIQEVRRIKKALAKAADYDIDRIIRDAKRTQDESGRTVVPPPTQSRAK
jgi:hypothetical protein